MAGELKAGDLVEDGAGTRGEIIEVRHIPSQGQGHSARTEYYIDWKVGHAHLQ